MLISPAKVIAACAGLTGFTVAILAGLAANNTADVILGRSVLALFVCYVVGAVIGGVMDKAVSEGIADYQRRAAAPDPEPAPGANAPAETRTP